MKSNRWTSRLLRTAALSFILFATQVHAGSAAVASKPAAPAAGKREIATFSGGCFWSMNAIFDRLNGVRHVTAGFSGGDIENPSYERVCTGTTGHAETVQVEFDPGVISYSELLRVFFTFHDPTTPNRQGADVGTQYRSLIFTHSPGQQDAARRAIADLTHRRLYGAPIVTRVQPYTTFYPAEDYHQGYYSKHAGEPYCRMVIAPKVAKLARLFAAELKPAI